MPSAEQEKTTSVSQTQKESGPDLKEPFSPRISRTLENLEKQSVAVNQTASKIANNALRTYEKTLTERLTSIASTSTVALEVALQAGIKSMREHQDKTWTVLTERQNGIWTALGNIQKSLAAIDKHLIEHANTLPALIKRTWTPIVISAAIGLLIIAGSWWMRPGLPSEMIEVKGRNGVKYLIALDPEWTTCNYQGQDRPCQIKRR